MVPTLLSGGETGYLIVNQVVASAIHDVKPITVPVISKKLLPGNKNTSPDITNAQIDEFELRLSKLKKF